jgi:hypothetical protein
MERHIHLEKDMQQSINIGLKFWHICEGQSHGLVVFFCGADTPPASLMILTALIIGLKQTF